MNKERLSESDLENARLILNKHGYQLLDFIGGGRFSAVFSVFSLKYHQTFCAKVIFSKAISYQLTYTSELQVLIDLDHPNIIRLYDTFTNSNILFLILELCKNGSLKKEIDKKGPLDPYHLKLYSSQILMAIQYCHLRGIAHRDIKPDNIFLTDQGICKLADFGLSRHVPDGAKLRQPCGSFAFFSPEIVSDKLFDPLKADIWAAGVSFYYFATGMLPWHFTDEDSLRKAIISGIFDAPSEIDPLFLELITSMLALDPLKRPTATQLLNSPYFRDNNSKNLPKLETNNYLMKTYQSSNIKSRSIINLNLIKCGHVRKTSSVGSDLLLDKYLTKNHSKHPITKTFQDD